MLYFFVFLSISSAIIIDESRSNLFLTRRKNAKKKEIIFLHVYTDMLRGADVTPST
jgi:hypothetical protein